MYCTLSYMPSTNIYWNPYRLPCNLQHKVPVHSLHLFYQRQKTTMCDRGRSTATVWFTFTAFLLKWRCKHLHSWLRLRTGWNQQNEANTYDKIYQQRMLTLEHSPTGQSVLSETFQKPIVSLRRNWYGSQVSFSLMEFRQHILHESSAAKEIKQWGKQ